MTGTQRKDDDMAQSSEEEWGRDGAEPGQTCSIPKGGSQGPTQSAWPGSPLLGHAIPSAWTLPSLQVHLRIASVWA